jgi:putative PIN family toxin of toxin-antitoxin system
MLKRQFVFDTNILVAGLRSKQGASFRLLQMLADNRILLNVSVALALEYEAVLKRPGLIPGFSEAEMDVFLDYILSVSTLWPSVRRLRPSLRDPDDERILEVAVQCDGIIVTHNRRDFDAALPFGVKIMSPAEVLEALKGLL